MTLGDCLAQALDVRYLGKQNLLEFGDTVCGMCVCVCGYLWIEHEIFMQVGACLLFLFMSLNLCDLYEGFIKHLKQQQEESSTGERERECVCVQPCQAHYPSLLNASVWILLLKGSLTANLLILTAEGTLLDMD